MKTLMLLSTVVLLYISVHSNWHSLSLHMNRVFFLGQNALCDDEFFSSIHLSIHPLSICLSVSICMYTYAYTGSVGC